MEIWIFLEYKGYKGSVEYSKEDNCLFGKVQGMSKALILYEGNTLEELRKDFEDGVDSYLEACKADGIEPAKPYSGRLNLRMSSELHSRVAAFVATTGTTINDFINKAIKNELNRAANIECLPSTKPSESSTGEITPRMSGDREFPCHKLEDMPEPCLPDGRQ